MLETNGILTQQMAPLFSDSVGRTVPRNWLAFRGRGNGRLIPAADVKQVQYEIMRGSRRKSTLISRGAVANYLLGSNQKNKDMDSYTQVSRATPLSMEQYSITNDKLLNKLPGEPTTNSKATRQFRLRYHVGVAQNEMLKEQMRLMNDLVGEGIRLGTQTAVTGDTDNVYDFYRNSLHSKTLSIPWSTAATATPLKNYDDAIDQMIKASGVIPTIALNGDDAWSYFQQTTEVKTFRSETKSEAYVQVGDSLSVPSEYKFLTDAGWEAQGFIRTWKGRKLWVFTCEALTDNASGVPVRTMPSEQVVLCNSNSRLDSIFGPPETLPETETDARLYQEWFGFAPGATPAGQPDVTSGLVTPGMFYLDAYRNDTKTAYQIRSQTAPLFVPVATDEWYTMLNAGS